MKNQLNLKMVKRKLTIKKKNPQHNQIWEWEETPELAAYIAKQTGAKVLNEKPTVKSWWTTLKKPCRWCHRYFGQGFDSPHLHKLGGAMVSTGYKEHDWKPARRAKHRCKIIWHCCEQHRSVLSYSYERICPHWRTRHCLRGNRGLVTPCYPSDHRGLCPLSYIN